MVRREEITWFIIFRKLIGVKMVCSDNIKQILRNYENTNAGIKSNLVKILMNGKLGGTGRLLILPVDQGHEHGPDKSFMKNPDAYDPAYIII